MMTYNKKLPFINRNVNLLISVGYGKQYRRDIYSTEYDHKPSIDKIVNFVL